MPDLSRFAAFAPARTVARVAPVARGNDDAGNDTLLDAYEERAAITEFDGGLPRDEAERRAWLEVFGAGHPSGNVPQKQNGDSS